MNSSIEFASQRISPLFTNVTSVLLQPLCVFSQDVVVQNMLESASLLANVTFELSLNARVQCQNVLLENVQGRDSLLANITFELLGLVAGAMPLQVSIPEEVSATFIASEIDFK